MKFTVPSSNMIDAIQKAAKVAPVKGEAFDKAQGIVFELDDGKSENQLRIKSTDLTTTFLQRMTVSDVEGSGSWRLPSGVLVNLVAQLSTAGEIIFADTMVGTDERVEISSGTTRLELVKIRGDSFPDFVGFDPSGMSDVDSLSTAIKQAAWAADRDHHVLSGLHIDGTSLVGCDRNSLATVAAEVPVDEPITVPMGAIASVLTKGATLGLRAEDKRLQIMVDSDTQMTSLIIEGAYPEVRRIADQTQKYTGKFSFDVKEFEAAVGRMMVLCKTERLPRLSVTVMAEVLIFEMDVPDMGRMEDEVELTGCSLAGDETFKFDVSPTILLSSVRGCSGPPKITFNPDKNLSPLRIEDSAGYMSVITVMQAAKGGSMIAVMDARSLIEVEGSVDQVVDIIFCAMATRPDHTAGGGTLGPTLCERPEDPSQSRPVDFRCRGCMVGMIAFMKYHHENESLPAGRLFGNDTLNPETHFSVDEVDEVVEILQGCIERSTIRLDPLPRLDLPEPMKLPQPFDPMEYA